VRREQTLYNAFLVDFYSFVAIYSESHQFLDEAASRRQYQSYGKVKPTTDKGLSDSLSLLMTAAFTKKRCIMTTANLITHRFKEDS
jgi:hypothetical protein